VTKKFAEDFRIFQSASANFLEHQTAAENTQPSKLSSPHVFSGDPIISTKIVKHQK